MAIYPIVDGQRPSKEQQPYVKRPSSDSKNNVLSVDKPEDNLIDFDNVAAAEPVSITNDTSNITAKEPNTIEALLAATGKPAEGPLIDFTNDLKRDLPLDNGA